MMRSHALRSSAEHAAFEEMVLAQGLGDADRQAPRDEKGDRRSWRVGWPADIPLPYRNRRDVPNADESTITL